MTTMRDQFVNTTIELLDRDPRVVVILADISADRFAEAAARHPHRVINVGIREQAMVGVAAGFAAEGFRPIIHTYAPFVVERAFEQLKLDLAHQGFGATVVTVGASYDASASGRTHHAPGDVALLDTLGDWTVHVPGHPDEIDRLLRAAARRDDCTYLRLSTQENGTSHATPDDRIEVARVGTGPVVLAVGPVLDNVLAAVSPLDATVLHAVTIRPLDVHTLRSHVDNSLVIVEPTLAGTSTNTVLDALSDRPLRLLSLGVGRHDVHHYGSPDDHDRTHGLDPISLRSQIAEWADVTEVLAG